VSLSKDAFAGRVALVTGASRGIGRAAALALAKAGAHVIAVARNVDGLEALDDEVQAAGGHATLVPLDVKDSPGIERMAAAVFERWKKLDAFLANAGTLSTLTPLTHLTPKNWDEAIAVNLTANWRLIRALDPLLRLSDGGRALFVSSSVAQKNRPYWGAYAVSKAALEALALTYAAECAGTNVKANIFHPGPTRTGMRRVAYPGEDATSLKPPEALNDEILTLLSPGCDANGEVFSHKSTG
jgi:NAD(P)-dependent dehydrogenase (short-subunit alcohol dehydrogenase family)